MTPAESLELLVADGIVDAVVQRVKTGKEAEVFVVRKGEDFLAAKVYKERNARNFKNNAGYKEGRTVRNSRDARALAKGSSYGRKLSENEWMHTEHDALVTVVNAGVRAPKAELFYEGILLMELVLDANGQPAPRLIEVPLSAEEAAQYHKDIVGQIIRMLTCDLIHGDLSPFNILLAWNGPTIIDLPQVIKAAHNSQSEQFLVRDVRNVTEYFAKFVPELKHRVYDGHAIWAKYTKRELSPDYFPSEGEGLAARPIDDGRRRHQGRAPGRPNPRPEHAPHANGPTQAPRPPAPAPSAHQPAEPQRPVAHANGHQRPHQGPPAERASRPHSGPPAERAPRPHSGPPAERAPRPHSGPPKERAPRSPNGAPHERAPRPERPAHHERPARTEAPRNARPQRPTAPRSNGPVIERVQRLVPAGASAESSSHGMPSAAPRADRSASRFQQHHRNRRPPQ
jgi:RIO kinase 1